MTPNVFNFVKSLNLTGKTLDVGAYNVNGCVRELFNDYIGFDMRPGPNVDDVGVSWYMPYSNNVFDNVVCLEMLEHDAAFWKSIKEMSRVLVPGGKLVITVPGIGFPRHDYPSDYWRFTGDAIKLLLSEYCEDVNVVENRGDCSVYGYGTKTIT